ncbi:MAG: phosphomannomutase/phosphoglucomutase [Patescibacteria group bacterium]
MEINKTIFKSYDIRGIYPDQLNENTVFEIGRGFVKHTGAKKIVVGHDARLSSPELFRSLVEGVISQGADVYIIGQVPTECLYFTVGNYDFDAGIMVTASHNPKEYNGFKVVKKEENFIKIIPGRDLLPFVEQSPINKPATKEGRVFEKDIFDDYFKHILSFVDLQKIRPFKVVIDASNGVIGNVISKIKNKLPIEIIELNFKPDGNFPNHSPNPLDTGASQQIAQKIKEEKANFGFMFDGDGDRIFLVDEKGELVSADIVLLLLAKHFLQKNSGAGIAYNAICSKAVPEFVKKWGGNPIRTQVGFVNVRDALIKNNGIMGGELSGHYCFKDYFYMDSGMITFLILLQIISKDARKVSEIVKELSPYFKSAELNFEIDDKETVLGKVKEKYSDGKQDFLDGVTVEYKDWWFNVRPSNTEPLLRLTIETDTKDMLELKKKELSQFINS